ncbi:hypothetical protein [Streptomyces sp. NBC_00448]|uniref:hypothetical protein n=1 Tax=Streptomyces sp. NBC_00448 TaxID=2903652 RepID=UPI002E23322D
MNIGVRGGNRHDAKVAGRQWARSEAELQDPELPYDELVLGYLQNVFADPRGVRPAAGRSPPPTSATGCAADVSRR